MADHSALLAALRPTLRYDSRERYFADAVASMVENRFDDGPMLGYGTRLLRADGSVIAGPGLTLGRLRAGTYPGGEPVRDDDRLDAGPEPVADARRRHADPDVGDVVYGHVAPRRGGGLWLQYWLFYFFSAKGLPGISGAGGLLGTGLHQGDWELAMLGIPAGQLGAADPVPDVAIYAAHEHAVRIAWDELDLEPDGSWPVFVGRASHASYPKPGRWKAPATGPVSLRVLDDVADGGGDGKRPALVPLGPGGPAWTGWPGFWGSTRPKPLIGAGSPRGPWRQRPWRDPDGFARDAGEWTDQHVAVGLEVEEVAPAPPAVAVVRAGREWTITVTLPAGAEDAWAGTLTLAANGTGEEGPVVRVHDVSAPGPAPAAGGDDG